MISVYAITHNNTALADGLFVRTGVFKATNGKRQA